MICRFCSQEMSGEVNTFRHRMGLCAPSRNEVESAIEQLEIEGEREKEAIRAFWKREREQAAVVTGKSLLKFFGAVLLAGAVLASLLYWHGWRWGIWQ